MIETTATDMARSFHEFLGKVQHGETVLIRRHGRRVARLVPDTEFMSGKAAADLFRSYRAAGIDRETADAIAEEIRKQDSEFDRALDH